ncbi:hypothetical protein [Tianweitania sediminis]|uniref:Lipoprotein n=1 Tax=Tianweitania sediminis TaxID=1502156 RepID=A0A8J7R776_9HYPH|nr:hypothetical protein [Tianweitania sediminis]MBP0439347.1 hypothetical protein [Tianweitania sediminis]
MVNSRNIAAVILALAPVAGCSSDHPIPPLDVGSSSRLLSVMPQNASLVDEASPTFSRTTPPSAIAYPRSDLSSAQASLPRLEQEPFTDGGGFGKESERVTFAGRDDLSLDERRRNAPQTLESQAASLGGVPTAVSRQELEEAPAATTEPAPLASTGPARIALAEVSGVGVDAAAPLANRFGEQARAKGLSFTSADDTSATHVMKGYFSIADYQGEAVVTYVWDITDRNGKRLHRIQGSEPGGGKASGWAGVTPAAMQRIADRSIEETSSFLLSEAG